MKKFIIIFLTSLIILGCSNEKNTNNNTNTNVSTITGDTKKSETKIKNNVLTIDNNIEIKEGLADDFPKDFNIIDGGKVYQNSNMKKYAFIIVQGKTIGDISNFYKTNLENNGWVIDTSNDINIDSNNDNAPKSIDKLTYIKKELKLNISINSSIPEILKDNFNFEGIFVEVQFEDIITNTNSNI